MGYVALVPARGGSKGIKNKNIIELNGKPLIYWVLEALVGSNKIDEIFVATDSDVIANVVNKGFADCAKVHIYERLADNAQDNSLTIDLVLEFITRCGKIATDDTLCLVQATSPLLRVEDVDGLILGYEKKNADSALTCVESKKYHWTKDGLAVGHVFSDRCPRQFRKDALLVENGAVYLNKVENIIRNKCLLSGKVFPYVMDYDSVWEIDEQGDLEMIERIMKKKGGFV